MTDKYNYITKDQFVDLLVQVKKAQVGDLRVIMKSELKYPNETLPFEKIQVDLLFPGSYCMNSKGLSPGTSNLEGFTEYPYKDETQRITAVKYLNKIKQKIIDTHNLKGQNRHKKALKDIAKKNQTYKEQKIELYKNPATPSLFLEYPVSLSLKNKSLPYKHIILLIDNEILYNLCLHDDKITERWNKTITEHYRSKKAKKYTSNLEPYYEWFEDREIVIDSNEYKDFPLLYDDRLEKGVDDDNQSIIEQQRKMFEQAEKSVNTELMQQLMQTHRDTMERMKKAGRFEQEERMKKLVECVAPPQVFLFPKEDEQQIIESTEIIKNPESDSKEIDDAIRKIEKVVKRNPTRQTRLILQRLIPYFEDDIRYKVQSENPDLDVNKYNKKIKTNFMQEIADDFELSLRRIKQIASDYSDDYEDFLPK